MKATSIKQRVKAIQAELKKNKFNGLIITKPANVTYATNFSGSDSWAIVTAGQVYLITDSRYTEQARKQCPHCKIINRTDSLAGAVGEILNKQKNIRIATVENSTSIVNFQALKKTLKASLKTAKDIVETIRTIKDAEEIELIKASAAIAARALNMTLGQIKQGITENELAGILDLNIRKLGATNSFDTIVAFGSNASQPHYQPGSRKLKKHDTILIDFGAKYNNYCSDITRCFVIGKPSPVYLKAYQAVKNAHDTAIKIVKAGVKAKDVDAVARKIIRQSNLPVYGHGTGHSFGIEIHEAPSLYPKSDCTLESGMVITIEPAIYIPGKLGIRIEDDILVTKNGCEILTQKCPHAPSLRL